MKYRVGLMVLLLSSLLFVFASTITAGDTKDNAVYLSHFPIISGTNLLFFDNFNDNESGWLVNDDGTVRRRYVDGEYEVLIRDPRWWASARAPFGNLVDYSIQADMRRFEGNTSDYGLAFDIKDWDNFYFFAVDAGDQWFGVAKIENGTPIIVVPRTDSKVINPDDALNTLRVDRVGEKIDVYINGIHLASGNDAGFERPVDVGVYMESDAEAPARVRYDNFTIWVLGDDVAQRSGTELRLEALTTAGGGSCGLNQGLCVFD